MKRLAALGLQLLLAFSALAQGPPGFYFTTGPNDRSRDVPVLFGSPGDTVELYLICDLQTTQQITALSAYITTTNSPVATPGTTTLLNPTIPTTPTPSRRWDPNLTQQSGGFFFGQVGATNFPGLDGSLMTLDPTYDPASGTVCVGSFPLTFNPGIAANEVKDIFFVPSLVGTDGGSPITLVQVGPGDAPIGATGGPPSALPDGFLIIENGLPGDFNNDGEVNGLDYVVWRNNEGKPGAVLANRGEASGDVVDGSDFVVWRDNFGMTSPSAPQAPLDLPTQQSSPTPPSLKFVDQGTTPEGNRKYGVQIMSDDPFSAFAVELAFEGAVVQDLVSGTGVDKQSDADTSDGTGGYDKDEDTWYVDSVFDYENPGNNPLTSSVTTGLDSDPAGGDLFVSLGSKTNHGLLTNLMQIVVQPGQEASYTGLIAHGDMIHTVSGVFQSGSILGDFDGDGDVDGVDIAEMFSNFNGPGGGVPGNPDTDLDGDGDVDGVDIALLFGAFTGPLAPANVPEPGSLALLGLTGLFARGRRH